jgi:hypothetical protein
MLGNFNFLLLSLWTLFGWQGINLFMIEFSLPMRKLYIKQISFTSDFALWGLVLCSSSFSLDASRQNFDVAMRGTFAVAATVLNDEQGNIIQAVTQKLVSIPLMRLLAKLLLPFWLLDWLLLLVVENCFLRVMLF